MPFDGIDALPPHLHAQLPLPVAECLRALAGHLPGLTLAEVDGPGPTGRWWLDLELQGFSPAIEWRAESGFGLYGPGPTLPEVPNAVVACPAGAAQRLVRLLARWSAA
jgi:hypothetical protein